VRRREPPRLLIEVTLEEPEPTVRLLAFTAEDLERLRVWLRGAHPDDGRPAFALMIRLDTLGEETEA
jgi:hypothetical protein